MTILFFGTEEEAGWVRVSPSNLSTSTLGAHYDSDFSRAAIEAARDGEHVIELSSAQSDFWFSCRYIQPNSGLPEGASIEFEDDTGLVMLRVYDTTPGQQFQYYDGLDWQTIYSHNTVDLYKMDIYVKFDASSGAFRFHVDKETQDELTGDTSQYLGAGGSGISKIRLLGLSQSSPNFSEVIVATDSTIHRRVATLYPTGDGTYTEMTGAYTDVDDAQIDDNEVLKSGTAGQRSSVTLSNLSSTADDFAVESVRVCARALKGSTGPSNLDIGLRTDGADDYKASQSLSTGYLNFTGQWDTNPDTGEAWTPSEINAIESIVRSAA